MGRKGNARRLRAWRALASVNGVKSNDDVKDLSDEALFFVDVANAKASETTGEETARKRAKARDKALGMDNAIVKARVCNPYPVARAQRRTKMFQSAPSGARRATRSPGDVERRRLATKARENESRTRARTTSGEVEYDVWGDGKGVKRETKARGRTKASTTTAAVAPAHPGCSFNPPKDAREDVVAVAIAKEMKVKNARYLNPVTVPVGNNVAEANLVNELYFESGFGGDASDEDGDGGMDVDNKHARAVSSEKYSKTKRNKLKRRAEAEAEEEANRKAKQLRRDLSNLKGLKTDIAAEDAKRDARLARLRAVRAERKLTHPARLGKLRHKEDLVAVRFADELDGGSLRTLKSGASLLRDRLKSYERRELIEPRQKVERKIKGKAVIKYEPGSRGEREIELRDDALAVAAEIATLRAATVARA